MWIPHKTTSNADLRHHCTRSSKDVFGEYKQEAHFSQRDYAMFPVIQNFAESFKVTWNDTLE